MNKNINIITDTPISGTNCFVIAPHPSKVKIYNKVNALVAMFLK
jgi:hypothetical protein